MKKYEIHPVIRPGAPSNDGVKTKREYFYHLDCYRVQKPKELLILGFKKITSDPKNIVAVEWAERIKKIMPRNTIWIKFEFIDENKRKIRISKLLQTSFLKNNRGRII
jgi:tRNA threonylcarbamoyladenosine biosynthesis protein TsaE